MSEYRHTLPPDAPSAVIGNGHIATSACDLTEAWQRRDRQYAERATPLSPSEVELIKQQRAQEARYVEPRMRGPLSSVARRWRAPKLGEWQ